MTDLHNRSEMATHYGFQEVGDVNVFYREAGPTGAPTILLLHGFPTASHMFRDLIPLLADRFRLIAPDLPGFGQTKVPPRGTFDYTFDHLADVVELFTEAMSLDRYALYIFDYGAPVGLRLAMRHPERVSAIISQNGNAYVEGFSDEWGSWEAYWREPSAANREACRPSLAPDTIRNWQYGTGADKNLLSPDGYELDIAYMARPGAEEIQLDLILDYRSNVALYPAFQSYFREYQPPLLTVWGRHDPAFLPAGAFAYQRDLPEAEVHLLDAGHFALETIAKEIATLIRAFMESLPNSSQQPNPNTPNMSTRKAIFPQRPHALYKQHGYSPAILSGDLLFVSGMVGAREDGSPEPDLEKQVQLAFESLRGVLEAAGCTFDDVVDVTMFLVDPEASMGLMLEAMREAFPREPLANATAVGVTWLSGFQFEIKVIARVPSAP